MKIPSFHRLKGFTLVELLVVITIIAVLASAGFSAGAAAIQKAKKTTALATATAIESAVNNFYTEYGSMPKDGTADATVQTDQGAGVDLLNELLGLNKNDPLNTRAIRFLSVREGKEKGNRGINGIIFTGSGTTMTAKGLYDPWGGPFFVRLDLDYLENLDVPNTVRNGGKTLNGRRVAVWSLGADAAPSGTGGKNADDVVTWGQ